MGSGGRRACWGAARPELAPSDTRWGLGAAEEGARVLTQGQ